jgi:predicted acyl esterase
MLPMRYGVRLETDVYRLAGAAPVPVPLTRTPYDEDQTLMGGAGLAFDIMRAVQAGFVVVIQDVRGRFGSEGDFIPHFQAANDGADTIAWAAAQEWSSGTVGAFGGSHLVTQWQAARERPPALRAMVSSVAPSKHGLGNGLPGRCACVPRSPLGGGDDGRGDSPPHGRITCSGPSRGPMCTWKPSCSICCSRGTSC